MTDDVYILYRQKFRHNPVFWSVDAPEHMYEEFERLVRKAVERGTPLTRAEVHAFRNFDDLPPGAVV